ncbi:MAG: NTP transferase domain-containing protein, partial [Rhodospirillaceae bacterium]
ALIAAAGATAGDAAICVPVQGGWRGNPVLFGRAHFAALTALDGDRGGKAVVQANAGKVIEVAVDDPSIHIDHDTPGG